MVLLLLILLVLLGTLWLFGGCVFKFFASNMDGCPVCDAVAGENETELKRWKSVEVVSEPLL